MATSERRVTRGKAGYWRFMEGGRRRCGPCEGKGVLPGGACSYCEGSGVGSFEYNWTAILSAASRIVKSYAREGSNEATVTLRQLFYRLVSGEMLPNTQQAYGSLSERTAEARRGESEAYGWGRTFPALMDRGRDIDRPNLWETAADASEWLSDRFMVPRASTQDHNIYVVVEKNALRGQLFQWFAPLGLPVIALGGYSSQTLADQVRADIVDDGRPAVCIYAGDFDADGEDILRDFEERVGRRAGGFDEVVRCALTPEQIEQFALPPQPGKWSSARARGFAEKYEELFESVYGYDLVQIELDALPPEELRRVYTEAIDEFFDRERYAERVEHERDEQAKIDLLTEPGSAGVVPLTEDEVEAIISEGEMPDSVIEKIQALR